MGPTGGRGGGTTSLPIPSLTVTVPSSFTYFRRAAKCLEDKKEGGDTPDTRSGKPSRAGDPSSVSGRGRGGGVEGVPLPFPGSRMLRTPPSRRMCPKSVGSSFWYLNPVLRSLFGSGLPERVMSCGRSDLPLHSFPRRVWKRPRPVDPTRL